MEIKSINEYQRIVWLHSRLKDGRSIQKSSYEEELESSSRTFQRDIEKMKSYFNAPIKYDRSSKSYTYTDRTYNLQTPVLTEKDIFGLTVAVSILDQYKNTPLYESIRKILETISSHLSSDLSYLYPEMLSSQTRVRQFDWKIIYDLSKAISNRTSVDIKYRSFNSEKETIRRIDPYHIYNFNSEFYLVAYCHQNQELRDFFVGRIKDIYFTDEHFEIENFSLSDYFSAKRLGMLKGGEVLTIVFEISKFREQWAVEKFGEKLKKISGDDNTSVYSIETEVNEDFFHWVFAQGDEIKIIEPRSVENQIVEKCKNILKNYNAT